jgi:hypothetical protein
MTAGGTPRLNILERATTCLRLVVYQAAAAADALRKDRWGIGTDGMDRRSVGFD